jgi:hypothetical protein
MTVKTGIQAEGAGVKRSLDSGLRQNDFLIEEGYSKAAQFGSRVGATDALLAT